MKDAFQKCIKVLRDRKNNAINEEEAEQLFDGEAAKFGRKWRKAIKRLRYASINKC